MVSVRKLTTPVDCYGRIDVLSMKDSNCLMWPSPKNHDILDNNYDIQLHTEHLIKMYILNTIAF